MKRAKRISAVVLSCIIVLSLFTTAFAAQSLNVSISTDKATVSNTATAKSGETFSLYFGLNDAFAVNNDNLNSYQFTLWYNPKMVTPIKDSGKNLIAVKGVVSKNGIAKESKTVENVKYNGYTFAFTSFEKGFGTAKAGFNALASLNFNANASGPAHFFLETTDVTLLPVVSADEIQSSKTIPNQIASGAIDVTLESAGSGSSSGGSGVIISPKPEKIFTVTFSVDGKATEVQVKEGNAVAKPQDPQKEGFLFKGWFKDSAFQEPYVFSDKVTKNMTLYAKFEKKEEPQKPSLPFIDVKEDDWFYESVEFVTDLGLIKGVSENKFAPEETLTRGTLVTLLYRLEKEPKVEKPEFSDVNTSEWYANAISWASQNKIVQGIGNGLFAPNDNITREQIAVILYKYAKTKQTDVSTKADLAQFSDASSVSDWAKEAMEWAVGKGLIKGMGNNTVNPGAYATRAEIATILTRFIEGK